MIEKEVVLEVKNLKKYFPASHKRVLKAVDDVSFTNHKGETFGIVGESGCGKTTCGKTCTGILTKTDGQVLYQGKDVHQMSKAERNAFTQKVQTIFQDPYASLNARMTVRDIIAEPLKAHHVCKSKQEVDEKVFAMLNRVGLTAEHAGRYAHEFSGGQRQRVGIARALIMNPKLIIADECISALDVSIQAQVVNLMKDIQQETGTAYLFIAHDLSMVKYISDRIGVLHLGHLLETGTTEEIFEHPIHPYTRSLLSAIPLPNPVVEKRRVAETYDYATSGIDYSKGTRHHVEGSHYVKCTDEEFAKWCK